MKLWYQDAQYKYENYLCAICEHIHTTMQNTSMWGLDQCQYRSWITPHSTRTVKKQPKFSCIGIYTECISYESFKCAMISLDWAHDRFLSWTGHTTNHRVRYVQLRSEWVHSVNSHSSVLLINQSKSSIPIPHLENVRVNNTQWAIFVVVNAPPNTKHCTTYSRHQPLTILWSNAVYSKSSR